MRKTTTTFEKNTHQPCPTLIFDTSKTIEISKKMIKPIKVTTTKTIETMKVSTSFTQKSSATASTSKLIEVLKTSLNGQTATPDSAETTTSFVNNQLTVTVQNQMQQGLI